MSRRTLLLWAALAVAGPASSLGADERSAPERRVVFEPEGTPFAAALAKARAAGLPLYVDVTSAKCGFCRLLEENAYVREDVAAALSGFLRLRIDGERGEGKDLARRYRVDDFPTLLFLDAEGEEVDRIAGYLRPEPLLREIVRIARGERTLPVLRRAVDADPSDVGATLALAAKLAETAPEESLRRLETLEARLREPGAPPASREATAEILLTKAVAEGALERTERARDLFERILRELPDTAAGRRAGLAGIPSFLDAPPRRALAFLWAAEALVPEGEVREYLDGETARLLHEALAEAVVRQAERAKDDAETLNDVAWTCFERRMLLEEATAWAERAVELSGRRPHVLDTLANLRFRGGDTDEAIRLEEEALRKAEDPETRAEFEETLVVFRALRDHRRRVR